METESLTVNDWLIKNRRLVYWIAHRSLRVLRKMTSQQANLEEVVGFVMEGMWKAWPHYDGRTKLSHYMTFCGQRNAVRETYWLLRRRHKQRLASMWWQEEKWARAVQHKSNSNGANRFIGSFDPVSRELPPIDAEIAEYDRIDTEVSISYALGTLPHDRQAILIRQAIGEETLASIAKSYGVSKQRIQQKSAHAVRLSRERFTKVRDW